MGRRSVAGVSERLFRPGSKRSANLTSDKERLFNRILIIQKNSATPVRPQADGDVPGTLPFEEDPKVAIVKKSYTIMGRLVKPFFL